jgi:hypothetical protein
MYAMPRATIAPHRTLNAQGQSGKGKEEKLKRRTYFFSQTNA